LAASVAFETRPGALEPGLVVNRSEGGEACTSESARSSRFSWSSSSSICWR